MLVNNYKLEVTWRRGCCSCWLKATATLFDDIGEAITRLASAFENSKYVPGKNIVSFYKDNILINISHDRIEIEYFENENQAHALVEWVKDLINKKYSEWNSENL
jgi:ArsR family metal-binding transcriptional regulator